MNLTNRQQRELDYHRQRAGEHAHLLSKPFSFDVLDRPIRRWWNAYWWMYAYLNKLDLRDKRVLVVGCGFGDDALRLAKMGADVYAFDLSAESLAIARSLASREGFQVHFQEMPAERLSYEDGFYDCIIARDILHHVDIPLTMQELVRVAKHGATLCVDEIYSHSITDAIRHSKVVEKALYPAMRNFVYANRSPYITEDERKLTETDLALVTGAMEYVSFRAYFNFLSTRLLPEGYVLFDKLDRLTLICLGTLGRYLAGRVLLAGPIRKN